MGLFSLRCERTTQSGAWSLKYRDHKINFILFYQHRELSFLSHTKDFSKVSVGNCGKPFIASLTMQWVCGSDKLSVRDVALFSHGERVPIHSHVVSNGFSRLVIRFHVECLLSL